MAFCTVATDAIAATSGNGATAIAGAGKLREAGANPARAVRASLVALAV